MSLATYSDLETAIANWLGRDGDATLTARVADFVAMCESRIAYGNQDPQTPSEPLRIRAMETLNTSLATVAGTNTIALPTGYLAMRRLQVISSPNVTLSYLTPAQFDATYNDTNITGTPREYTIEGENIRLGPIPDAVYPITCLYYQKFTGLATTSTNWLMTNSPGAYLYGSLLEAALFTGDDAGAMKWYRAFVGMINGLNAADSSDRHSGGALTMRTDLGNP